MNSVRRFDIQFFELTVEAQLQPNVPEGAGKKVSLEKAAASSFGVRCFMNMPVGSETFWKMDECI